MNGISPDGSYRGGDDSPHSAPKEPDNAKEIRQTRRSAWRVWRFVGSITTEDFRWQESHYDHDSRHGRELLFLIANNEWIRGTSEIIEVSRSDAIDSTIKIDIDLNQVTHEAFNDRWGRFWLPIIVLPPEISDSRSQRSVQYRQEPDPFATVTDASGTLLAMLPNADVRHRISAAMAEIIVNMAVARWIGPEDGRPTATRDQRLVLSAAIYRLLCSGTAGPPRTSSAADAGAPALGRPKGSWRLSRLDNAKAELGKLFRPYMGLPEEEPEGAVPAATASDAASDGSAHAQASGLSSRWDRSTLELTRRAIAVLEAFARSPIVVVPIDRESTPTVLTVRVPTREMSNRRAWVVRADNRAYGEKACKYIGEHVKSGKVVQIMGDLASVNGRDRSEAFRSCLKGFPALSLLEIPAAWKGDVAATALDSLLTANPDVKAIYMQAGGVYLSPTLQTLRRKQMLFPIGDAKHVVIVSNDGIPQEFDAIRRGDIDATISQPADSYAKYGLFYIKAALAGQTFKPGPTDHGSNIIQLAPGVLEDQLPAPLVTKSNVDDKALWGNTVK